MKLATTKGRPHVAAREAFPPQGGRWPAGPDEGAACGTFVVNGIPQSPPCGGDSPLSQGGRAHAVRPYGNTHHRRARPLGAPRPAGSSGPTEYAPCRAFVMRVGAHLCVRPEREGGHAGPPLREETAKYVGPPREPSEAGRVGRGGAAK